MPLRDFSQMRRRYYIVRPEPNKTCVPMVALDELPAGLRLKGVPMTVTPQQIQDWDMARVGADIALTDSFEVEFDRQALPKRGQKSGTDDKNVSSTEKTELSKEAPTENEVASEKDKVERSNKNDDSVTSRNSEAQNAKSVEEDCPPLSELQQQANVSEAISCLNDLRTDLAYFFLQEAAHEFVEQSKWDKDNDRSKTHDAATPGVYGKKKFCTHWIRTGNCDYMQEGCRYLHVIPDAETRLRIGIRDMPRWAKEDLPSPPRELNRARRRSWSPPKEKKDSHKDWRYRGNRKAHAELPAGPPLFSRPGPARPSTPTPQTTLHGKYHGSTHASLPATQLANPNHHETATSPPMQRESYSVYHDREASGPTSLSYAGSQLKTQPRTQQGPTTEESFTRQQQFTPLLSNSTPLPVPPPQSFSDHTGGAFQGNQGGYSYRTPFPDDNHGAFRSSNSLGTTPSSIEFGRMDSGFRGYPSHQPHHMPTHQHTQSRLITALGYSMASPWLRGQFRSPTPSFSEASVGTIGHGRPGSSDRDLSSPMAGSPILHKRLFRRPGESQYVQAQPEPKAKSKDTSSSNSHKGKGMTTFTEQEGNGGRSGELGNLIAFDE